MMKGATSGLHVVYLCCGMPLTVCCPPLTVCCPPLTVCCPPLTMCCPPTDRVLSPTLCSQDNKVLLWDIRKATGPLLSLDQHNGSGSSNVSSGKSGHHCHGRWCCSRAALVQQRRLLNGFQVPSMHASFVPLAVVTAHGGHVNGLCFSSDGLFLASFGTDNHIRLWDTFSGRNTLVRGRGRGLAEGGGERVWRRE